MLDQFTNQSLFEDRDNICYFCGKYFNDPYYKNIVIHHKKPIDKGGGHNLDNLEYAHRVCHDECHKSS